MRYLGAATLVFLLATAAGCGGEARLSPATTPAEVRTLVRDEIANSPSVRNQIDLAVKREGVQPMISQTLQSPGGQKILSEEIKKILDTPDMQKSLEQVMTKVLSSSEVKKSLQKEVHSSLMQIVVKGGQSGGQSSGGGGGSSGSSGSGGGSGGGGGGTSGG